MDRDIPNIGSIPSIGLGTWRLSGSECTQSIKTALGLGYRHIDTADIYKNHEEVGRGIEGFPREQLYIVSKLFDNNLDPKNVVTACERILRELKTPYLDLLLIHWPSETIPFDQTLKEMLKLKERGLVRDIGVSNFMILHLKRIEKEQFPILANQIELHPYLQENELVNYCQQHKIIVVAYRPIQRATVNEEPLLQELGKKHNKTPVQITLRWIYQRKIVAIPKAKSQDHLRENLEIFDFSLSEEEMKAIAGLDAGKRFVF